MDKPSLSPSPALEVKESPSGVPRFFAAVALLLGAGYPALVLAGKVQPTNRLTAAEIALVLVAMTAAVVVVSPRFLGSIRKLKLSGFELELDQVREQQQRQRARLVEIDMLLPLLMPDAQFRHLENLVKRTTTKYRGGSAVREELRKLASSGLIRRRPGRSIASLKSDLEFDLADYVELTQLGAVWGERYIQHKERTNAERDGEEPRDDP